jgi:hypothetical protein
MRAVVVLLLLIANAIVASRNSNPVESAPAARTDSSLALLSTVDGAAPEHGRPGCAADGRLACRFDAQAGETPACRTGEDARAPIFRL